MYRMGAWLHPVGTHGVTDRARLLWMANTCFTCTLFCRKSLLFLILGQDFLFTILDKRSLLFVNDNFFLSLVLLALRQKDKNTL